MRSSAMPFTHIYPSFHAQANFARPPKITFCFLLDDFLPKIRGYEPSTGVYICEYIMTQ
jgi:hypothetical protein